MDKYQDYLEKIKRVHYGVDYGNMFQKITRRKRNYLLPATASIAAAAAAFAIAAVIYFLPPSAGNDPIINYAVGDEKVNGSQLISYVFE